MPIRGSSCAWTVLVSTILFLLPAPKTSSAPFADVRQDARPSPDVLHYAPLFGDLFPPRHLNQIPISSPAELGPTTRGVITAVLPAAAGRARRASARPSISGTPPPAAPRKVVAGPLKAQPRVVRHRIARGDTLYALSRRHGVTVQSIVAANRLASAHRLREGRALIIPVPVRAAPLSAAAAPLARVAPVVTARRGAPSRLAWAWPARGVLTSRFGWRWRRHHDGIDLSAQHGAPIYAALPGRVIFSGWYYGYGRAVIIEHRPGMTTLYGHASALLVKNNQLVRRGQVIARVGCTGSCTGAHLHFEVRVDGRAVNPLSYLP